jgi:hypothetical protein
LAGEDPRNFRRLMQIFDWSRLPTLYRQRTSQNYTALKEYRPRPTLNRVVYLRSRVGNLIHRNQPDGGWGRYVSPESLRTYSIPGDHGSSLHARWRPALSVVLRQALNAVQD